MSTPMSLPAFAAQLVTLSPEEARKLKSLYVRSLITHWRGLSRQMDANRRGVFRIHMWLLDGQVRAQLQTARDQVVDAVTVFKEDLRGESFGEPWVDALLG